MEKEMMLKQDVKTHFRRRSQKYNASSAWVNDRCLIRKIFELSDASPKSTVLDIAAGTGKIAEPFYNQVKYVIGIDLCPKMTDQARPWYNHLVFSAAEKLPFKDNSFDICVCRQGLQFMKLDDALRQIHRVLKPDGTTIFCHLSAFSEEDKEITFYIQRLRNPARKNCFLPEDIPNVLDENQFVDIECHNYITRESVSRWINNGAIDKKQMAKIIEIYRKAPHNFLKIHNVEFRDGDIFDSMLMNIVKAKKKG